MTDVKRLLAEAAVETPLGDWWTNGLAIFDNIDQPIAEIEDSTANAALIVYAVNHLPDFLTVIEKARLVSQWHGSMNTGPLEELDAELAELAEAVRGLGVAVLA